MRRDKKIKVAIIGGGCAGITTAFELTRPEHKGRFAVTVYQLGWRLGGKGASGRGPSGRIEEHGLHVWMGFYHNAFRLLRECYAGLGRDPRVCPIADWDDAFAPDSCVGVTDRARDGRWLHRIAEFPTAAGLPGDVVDGERPFTVGQYLVHAVALLRMLLMEVHTGRAPTVTNIAGEDESRSPDTVVAQVAELFRFGALSTAAGLTSAVGLLGTIFKSFSSFPQNLVLDLLERVASAAHERLETLVAGDDDVRYRWEIIDLVVAIIVGIVRHGLIYHPKAFDAINDYECLDWLRMNGASETTLRSAFVRGLYDLAFASDKDGPNPGVAAGQALRGSLRMLFTYRGAMFWKMKVGMGDAVFAPFYEVLKRRGVRFEFFHRLENVGVAESARRGVGRQVYVDRLEFNVQAAIKRGVEYQPLIDVRGVPCWPSKPDFAQLVGGDELAAQNRDLESDWDVTCADRRTLRVGDDFDLVVLAIGIGAVPSVCREILARDERWRDMVEHVKTVETQAFQVWLSEDASTLGWDGPPVTLAGFVHPFNTWGDMRQVIPMENWSVAPRSVAYFCNRLPEDPLADRSDPAYPAKRRDEVKRNAIAFLERYVAELWPASSKKTGFDWNLLKCHDGETAGARTGKNRFDSQFWTANVNNSDRYVLAPPGSLQYRISPLDRTYDNLTIAGDWTDCGFNEGCVEAAVMSGRLAAHALSAAPALEDIIGYDHP